MSINKKILNTVIVGFGKLGLLHFSQFNAHPDVNVYGICESDKIVSKLLRKNFDKVTIYDQLSQIPTENIDFAVVSTPTGAHYEVIEFFLKKKIPVFSEKPLALNYNEANRLKELSEINSTLLYVGYMYEFFETFEKAFELVVKNKIIGNFVFCKGEMYVSQIMSTPKKTNWRFIKKKSGGGVLITQTSHLIYLIQKFIGEYQKCFGVTKKIFSDENEDYAHIVLTTKDNVVSTIDASWSALNYRVPSLKLFIEGSKGNIAITEDKIELFLNDNFNNYKKGMNIISKMDLHKNSYFNVAGNHYAHQANHFIKLIEEKKHINDNLYLSVLVNKIIDEVYK